MVLAKTTARAGSRYAFYGEGPTEVEIGFVCNSAGSYGPPVI